MIDFMQEYADLIEENLKSCFVQENLPQQTLVDAMAYSLLDGGKRIRPILTLEFSKVCGGNVNHAMPFACAVEMVHTYSLIHDDLPCMDNDDMRRGKLSNHKKFSEDTALLAGDALLTMAFEVMLNDEVVKLVGAEKTAKAAGFLAKAAGGRGMVGGQIIDLASENKPISLTMLQHMHALKTGVLIESAALMGVTLAGANKEETEAALIYAGCVGASFQIMDDILDVTGTTLEMGKPIGSDEGNNKSTYVSLMGIEKAKEMVTQLTNEAIEALQVFKNDTTHLKELAIYLSSRNH